MFAFNLISALMCSRELLRPSAILRWIETSHRRHLARRGLALACNGLPLVFRTSVN